VKENECRKVQNNGKHELSKIKRRVCIGGCAIFAVICYELWNIPDVTPAMALLLALYMAVTIGFLGFLFIKKMLLYFLEKSE